MAKFVRVQHLFPLGLALTLVTAACGDDSSDKADASGGSGGGTATTSSGGPGTSSSSGAGPDGDPSDKRFFDHRHTALDQIPASCIDSLKSGSSIIHYAHRSHGSQIIVGAESIEASTPSYGFDAGYCSAPAQPGALRMWDGMASNNLVEADGYWGTDAGLAELRAILGAHPEIRYSMWAWSFEISEQTEPRVQQYLDTVAGLEREFPQVTFIYMTGPAQETYNGVNRTERNEQIRSFARDHGKVLYDFEDLDSHWNGEAHTEVVESVTIPMEHPHFNLEASGSPEYEYTHTTQESCENKARAFWWMMAKLDGCDLP